MPEEFPKNMPSELWKESLKNLSEEFPNDLFADQQKLSDLIKYGEKHLNSSFSKK